MLDFEDLDRGPPGGDQARRPLRELLQGENLPRRRRVLHRSRISSRSRKEVKIPYLSFYTDAYTLADEEIDRLEKVSFQEWAESKGITKKRHHLQPPPRRGHPVLHHQRSRGHLHRRHLPLLQARLRAQAAAGRPGLGGRLRRRAAPWSGRRPWRGNSRASAARSASGFQGHGNRRREREGHGRQGRDAGGRRDVPGRKRWSATSPPSTPSGSSTRNISPRSGPTRVESHVRLRQLRPVHGAQQAGDARGRGEDGDQEHLRPAPERRGSTTTCTSAGTSSRRWTRPWPRRASTSTRPIFR